MMKTHWQQEQEQLPSHDEGHVGKSMAPICSEQRLKPSRTRSKTGSPRFSVLFMSEAEALARAVWQEKEIKGI